MGFIHAYDPAMDEKEAAKVIEQAVDANQTLMEYIRSLSAEKQFAVNAMPLTKVWLEFMEMKADELENSINS